MPLITIAPDARKGKPPCGECHIRPGETCDICGAKQELEPRPFPNAPQGHDASQSTSPVRPAATASTSTAAGTVGMRNGSETAPRQSGAATDARWNWQWDDKQSGGKPWSYDRADLRAGVICLGSYSRWTDESILRDGVDPLRPIRAWMYQARYVDGIYNEEPDGWFATVAEAKAFVEAEADKMLAAAVSPREPDAPDAGEVDAWKPDWPHVERVNNVLRRNGLDLSDEDVRAVLEQSTILQHATSRTTTGWTSHHLRRVMGASDERL